MFIDPHLHTCRYSSCSQLEPEELVSVANLLGLDGIIITEHNFVWSEEEIAELRRKAPALVILRGQEIRAYKDGFLEGDLLVFGFYEIVKEELSSVEIIELVHQAGGVVLAAHPFRSFLGIGDKVYSLKLDGIEVLNSNHTREDNIAAEKARSVLNLPAMGGSDAHCVADVGNYLTFFENWIENEAQLVEEIKHGRCRPISCEDMYKT
jgi:predicted metal-dependent phosphoesterase TrpH